MVNDKHSLMSKIRNVFSTKNISQKENSFNSIFYDNSAASWTAWDFHKFADEAYCKNVVAHRAINMISQGAASVPWKLYRKQNKRVEVTNYPILDLLHRPNPGCAGAEFFEKIYAYKLISGDSFVLAAQNLQELHILRPDLIEIVADSRGVSAYKYKNKDNEQLFPVNCITGQARVLHLRNFNPLDDLRGLSSIKATAYSIDQHNQAAEWNQSLLQNGARPCGALVIDNASSYGSRLTTEQYERLKEEVKDQFTGPASSGKPLILEGGMSWQEMSISPKDMDYIEAKNSAARDIALGLGVPPQLLGIPGDNTYNNMQEARLALWEETILPLLDHTADALNHWLVPMFKEDLEISYNIDAISGLSARREKVWKRIESASFLTVNEKREMVGLSPINKSELKGGK